ncbi:c-type cytochrome biogenesis protein CcsB [Dactylosporangium sucinum]|uniref:C-type cytochrome biogenesis protein CcsB n=1 Tax=Dactylosporangium sucinum TaxID=1424081 RepID=A0A917X3T7_9ACTN|nr:c-type cytochrome biogenesis protein CcsB [Dactylosporangium sucinum]GGM67140.1 c-type cytochrome biogenesis protein CcsB [Dactylosporangium sucinum]
MAPLSDQLLAVTLVAYLLAMVAYTFEHAVRRVGSVAPAASRLPAVRVAASPAASQPSPDPELTSDAVPSPWAHRAGWAAIIATGIGVIAHLSCLISRGIEARRVPWGNMYEFVLAVTLVGVLAWLAIVLRRPAIRPVGLYVTLAAVILLGLAGMRLYTAAGPLVPALNSYWLKIHVSTAAIASGIFLLGFIAASGYLARLVYDRAAATDRPPGLVASVGRHLPAAATLERLSFQAHAVAFPIWSFAVGAGAIWAEAAWGRYWGWDPKETWAFISWVAYAGYLHAHATPSIKRPVVAYLAIVAWGTMMFNLFAVNLLIAGLHSYAGTE